MSCDRKRLQYGPRQRARGREGTGANVVERNYLVVP